MNKQFTTIVMCLLCASTVFAQDEFKINISDAESHQNVKKIWVVAERVTDKMRDSVLTDENGIAIFKNLKKDEKYCFFTKANNRYENSTVRVLIARKNEKNQARITIYRQESFARN